MVEIRRCLFSPPTAEIIHSSGVFKRGKGKKKKIKKKRDKLLMHYYLSINFFKFKILINIIFKNNFFIKKIVEEILFNTLKSMGIENQLLFSLLRLFQRQPRVV